jgi:hypothetical protein
MHPVQELIILEAEGGAGPAAQVAALLVRNAHEQREIRNRGIRSSAIERVFLGEGDPSSSNLAKNVPRSYHREGQRRLEARGGSETG